MNNDLKIEALFRDGFTNGHIRSELCARHKGSGWFGCCRCLNSFMLEYNEEEFLKKCPGLRATSADRRENSWCSKCWAVLMTARKRNGLRRLRDAHS